MKKIVLGFVVLLICNLSFAIGVEPLSKDINAKPGDSIEEKLSIDAEAVDKTIKIELYDLNQNTGGEYSFLQSTDDTKSTRKWITFSDKVLVPAGQKTLTDIKFKIPLSAKPGTYNFILMVTPETEKTTGISLVMRYAVRYTINIEGITMKKVELSDVTISPDQERKPTIVATVTNVSEYDIVTSVSAIIRDEKGKIIEKLPLKSLSMSKSGKNDQKIMAGNKVVFFGTSEYLVSAGKYKLNIFLNYDEKQKIFTSGLEIPEGVFAFKSGQKLALRLDQHELHYLNLYAGAAKSSVIKAENLAKNDTIVQMKLSDFPSLTKDKSLLNWLTIRAANPFKLPSGRNSSIVTSLNIPKDTKQGAYYGQVVFYSFTPDGTFITQETVNLEVIIGKVTTEASIISYKQENQENNGGFMLMIKNTGDTYIIPKAVVKISNDKKESIGSFDLFPTVEGKWMMPGETESLYGDTIKLKEGNYFYDILINNNTVFLMKQSGILKIGSDE